MSVQYLYIKDSVLTSIYFICLYYTQSKQSFSLDSYYSDSITPSSYKTNYNADKS